MTGKSLADGPLFRRGTWKEHVDEYLSGEGSTRGPFLDANRRSIQRCIDDKESGLRMVVNIPADALLSYLASGRYLNAYDLPVVAGKRREPSESRRTVDSLLGFDDPKQFYFGAASIGGAGIRFYGEYCMVLKRDTIARDTQVLDRNSYDALCPPLDGDPKLGRLVDAMKGRWDRDVVDMLVLKVLPELSSAARLVTLGTVSDAVLHDEDFVEIHRRGSFAPDDLEEIRETPEDQSIHSHIVDQLEDGSLARSEQIVWVIRRLRLRSTFRKMGLTSRVVASAGRGTRWD